MTLSQGLSSTSTISASPTKRFFVEMLTRDIELEDAILDLLDNCVDGIQRIANLNPSPSKPYEGFCARVTFTDKEFKIEDNCGGIPLEDARDYAFRMGRPLDSIDNQIYTIGTYGIGMKRSIFKMGSSSEVISRIKDAPFKVTITPEWLTDDSNWDLPIEPVSLNSKEYGTTITINELYSSIRERFSSQTSTLYDDLVGKISLHYSFIIDKGFMVIVNGKRISSKSNNLLWDGSSRIREKYTIAPYLYEGHIDGVDVRLAVGFYRSIPDEKEINDEIKGIRRRSNEAGWTIVCNDRVVVYCDKSRLTGWGEMTIPSYHTQFIAISGIVEFRSKDPQKLPITTTKRGIDASSDVYLYIKNYMREGLKLFTSYTNKWKSNLVEEKERINQTQAVAPNDLFEEENFPSDMWKKVKNRNNERKYLPSLPTPTSRKRKSTHKTIKFSRDIKEIELVSDYLFEQVDRDPSEVGNECFEKVLRQAKQ